MEAQLLETEGGHRGQRVWAVGGLSMLLDGHWIGDQARPATLGEETGFKKLGLGQ